VYKLCTVLRASDPEKSKVYCGRLQAVQRIERARVQKLAAETAARKI
jgi:hypothetical protein